MQKEFEPGDVVELKSGSPPMTVEGVHPDGDLDLVWWKPNENCFGSKHIAKQSVKLIPTNSSPKV
jgi:uncharacterized protein YodC (DUF2158 family)